MQPGKALVTGAEAKNSPVCLTATRYLFCFLDSQNYLYHFERHVNAKHQGSNWTGVELDEFMNCPYNLAHNRQTRMLADLTLAGCYTGYNSTADQMERDRILLQSAKKNLAEMAYFGLTEQQSVSQYIFEQTFQLDFANSFDQANATLSAQAIAELTSAQVFLINI